MNNIAISPNIGMYALQNQNVERKIAKTIDINHLQKKDSTSIDELTNNIKSVDEPNLAKDMDENLDKHLEPEVAN